MLCYLYPEPVYFFFAEGVPGLLYYSHIPATVIALAVGLFVFLNAPRNLTNRILLLIALCFSGWTFINLIAWTNIHSNLLLFSWSFYGVLQALISIFSIYFIYVFVHKHDAPTVMKLVLLVLALPVIVLAPTDFHVSGFNLAACDAFDFENIYYKGYYTLLGLIALAWSGYILVKAYRVSDASFRKQIILMGTGIEFFLLTFFSIVFIATYLTEIGFFSDSRVEMFGLFGMTVFMVFIGILIVEFKAFNVGFLASNALIIALLILVASQFTFATTLTSTILTSITLTLTSTVGILLVKSVRREIEQRKQIEQLATRLQGANKRLKVLDQLKSEFVSIASHQLRSPLTSIRGYASMLLEGSFGKLPQKAEEAVSRIAESSRFMALSVEDYLNVSRIQSGNMKYVRSEFSLKDVAKGIADDMRPEGVKRGLLITFTGDTTCSCVVNADVGKTRQIIQNLVDNALKYTKKGSIEITVYDKKNPKRVYVDVKDTGIGMSAETLESIFGKFERARNANDVNVTGTGLGLYVAKKMAEDMGGTITATSPGENQGSTFTLALPYVR